MTYRHVPGHPVADIYEEYLTRQAINNAVIASKCIRPMQIYTYSSPVTSVATEHPVEAEEGWLGTTDFESDSPGGWAR